MQKKAASKVRQGLRCSCRLQAASLRLGAIGPELDVTLRESPLLKSVESVASEEVFRRATQPISAPYHLARFVRGLRLV
jgi:hypothetical protein